MLVQNVRRLSVWLVLLVLIVLGGCHVGPTDSTAVSAAAAAPSSPPQLSDSQVDTLYAQGIEHVRLGQYDEALALV